MKREPLVLEGRLRCYEDGIEDNRPALYLDNEQLCEHMPEQGVTRGYVAGPSPLDGEPWEVIDDAEMDRLKEIRWRGNPKEPGYWRAGDFYGCLIGDYGRVRITVEWLEDDNAQ